MAEKKNIRYYYSKIPNPIRNKYILTAIAFCVWMLFFDRHDVYTQIKLSNTLVEMTEKNKHFGERIEEINSVSKELKENDDAKERFARESYYMKKDDEEVFVIERKE